MRKRMLWAFMALLMLLPASFGGLTLRCDEDGGGNISDAFEDLIEEIEDAF